MKSLFAGAILLALMSGCASTAETETAAADPSQQKLCTKVKQMGSNMAQKVCKTRAQWEAVGAVPPDAQAD